MISSNEILPRLDVEAVSVRYGRRGDPVLDGVTFTADQGTTLLLGPNGAGKSTLISVIAGAYPVLEGTVRLLTLDGEVAGTELRMRTGLMPQSPAFVPRLTGRECVEYVAWLRKVPRSQRRSAVTDALARAHADHVADTSWAAMSYGTRQRVAIAAAMVNDPVLLLLDEPLNGLDIAEKHSLLAVLRSLGESVVTILSSHIVDNLAEHVTGVVLLANRSVRYAGATAPLVREHGALERAYLALASDVE